MKIAIIVVFCMFFCDADFQELSEDKTLIDQLFGKVDTNASSSSESTKLDFQVTRFLVGVAIEERPGPRWAIKCLGVLISKTSFLSTSTCLPLGKHAIITSDNPASGFLYAYGYTKGEPVPPYLQWATLHTEVVRWPALIPLLLSTEYDYKNKPASRLTVNKFGRPELKSLLVEYMNDGRIYVPKTSLSQENVLIIGELLFFDSRLGGIFTGYAFKRKYAMYQVVKDVPGC